MRREDGGQLSPEMSPAMQGGLSGDHRRGEKSCRGGGSLDAPAGRCLLWGRGGRTGVRLGALYGCSTCSRARRRQKREDAGIQGRLTDCEYSGGRRKRRDGRCRGHCTRRRIRISSLMGTARSRAGRICIREHGGREGVDGAWDDLGSGGHLRHLRYVIVRISHRALDTRRAPALPRPRSSLWAGVRSCASASCAEPSPCLVFIPASVLDSRRPARPLLPLPSRSTLARSLSPPRLPAPFLDLSRPHRSSKG